MKTRKATSDLVKVTKIHKVGENIKHVPKICAVCKGRGTVWNISMDRFINCTHCDNGVMP
jgi:hypothetical protein